jgi:hypothetical protein
MTGGSTLFWVSPAAAIRDALFAAKVCYLSGG